MPRPVAYDVTRLATRVLSRTPNGIDRIDSAFAARYLLARPDDAIAVMMGLAARPRVVSAAGAADIVEGVARHWGEDETPEADDAHLRVRAFLEGRAPRTGAGAARVARGRTGRAQGVGAWLRRHGFPLGEAPETALPEGARYLNVSQFPLWIPGYFSWLRKRPDVRAAFFIHDVLPLEHPEYFRPAEFERHQRRLANLAAFAAGAVVTTGAVRAALRERLKPLGRADLPIHVAPIPPAPVFSRPAPARTASGGAPYFVACGTIEPRKNHLLLLHVWRELARRAPGEVPKLVLVGARGWENENVVDLLERCPAVAGHVVEASGLSTPGLKALLDGACALLAPSFAEGYGLPIPEALAAGVPVIASDIPAFHESGAGAIVPLSPLDGEGWLAAVRAFAREGSPERAAAQAKARSFRPPDWDAYFAEVESFVDGL
ncbi:glycosyltransferase [Methylocella sp.]|uniref:glycosyltransferase n=1 Tax=Methylocella sp. TaxID=1978226 RepID=UPI0037830752